MLGKREKRKERERKRERQEELKRGRVGERYWKGKKTDRPEEKSEEESLKAIEREVRRESE